MACMREYAEYWKCYCLNQYPNTLSPVERTTECGHLPDSGVVTVNCDASWNARTNSRGIIVVACDHTWDLIDEMKRRTKQQGGDVTEGTTIADGLKLAKVQG